MAAQWWYGSAFIKEENGIGGSGWKRQRLHVPDILENFCLPHQGRTYGNKIRLQDDYVCPNMAAAVKEFLEAYGPVLVP